jgi:CHAT domain-containing protein
LARGRLLEALSIFSRVGTAEDVIQTRRDLASVDAAMGNLRSALTQLREGERLLARGPGSADLAAGVALTHADVAVQLNEYAEAERHYGMAQSLYRRAGDQVGEAEAREGSASLLIKRQQYAQAQSQLEAIVRSEVAADARRPAALSRLVLGYVREQRGDTLGARRLITMARDSLHTLGDAVGEAAAWVGLGGLDLDRRSPLAAEAEYRRGLAVLGTRTAPSVSWQLRAGLGQALRARGATGEAALELRSAIAELERMATTLPAIERRSMFLTDKWQPYADLALIQRETGSDADAFLVSERMRARQMLDLVSRGVVSRPTTADSEAVAREHELRRRIAELTQRLEAQGQGATVGRTTVGPLRGPDVGDAETGVTREALAHAQEEYEHVLIALQDESGAGTGADADVASSQSVARTLRRDQALLEYLVTDSTTLLFVVRSDTLRALDLGVGRLSLASLIEFARGTMGRVNKRSIAAWRGPLRRLYGQLVAPAEDSGMLDGVRELVIVPHGELHYLPFAALIRSGQREQFLLERYDIGYSPSATVWLRLAQRRSSANTNVLALAPRASTLPGSRDEVQAIGALYGRDATVLTDRAASERAFRGAAGQFGIVHFATYGVLNQHNPLFSFVELNPDSTNDGRLEVHEVFGIQLRARLVVLSACQTGLASGIVSDVPAGDDWVGLVRAFLAAGAEHVVATLWAVEDRSTASLMERLHRKYKAGMSAVAALSAAQRETLRNADTAGPFYWAGFVAVGGGSR